MESKKIKKSSGTNSAGLQWYYTYPKSYVSWCGQSVLQNLCLFIFEANMSWTKWKAAKLTYKDYPC